MGFSVGKMPCVLGDPLHTVQQSLLVRPRRGLRVDCGSSRGVNALDLGRLVGIRLISGPFTPVRHQRREA